MNGSEECGKVFVVKNDDDGSRWQIFQIKNFLASGSKQRNTCESNISNAQQGPLNLNEYLNS